MTGNRNGASHRIRATFTLFFIAYFNENARIVHRDSFTLSILDSKRGFRRSDVALGSFTAKSRANR